MSKRRKNRPHPPSIKFRTAPSGRGRVLILVVATLVLVVAVIYRWGRNPATTTESRAEAAPTNQSVPPTEPVQTEAPAAPAVSQPDLTGVVPPLEAPVENPDTNSVSDMINLGNWLLSQDRLEEAEQAYLRAIEINPDDEDAHFNRGIALARQRRFDEAVVEYQKTLEIFPDYVEVRNNLANALIELGRREEAVKELELALEINPEYVQALNNLGRIRALNKEWDQAIELLGRAAALDPQDFEVPFNLGNVHLQRGDPPGAVRAFESAVQLRPEDLLARNMLARALVADNRIEPAFEVLRESLRLHPNSPEVLFNLGQLQLLRGQPAEAIPHLERVIQLAPGFVPAQEALKRAQEELSGTVPPPALKSAE